MTNLLKEEIQWRNFLFEELGNKNPILNISPSELRKLNIYGGAQGIYIDKKRTKPISQDEFGLAMSLLHTGEYYSDDFDESGVIYHYPTTNRPSNRDKGEIESVKNCLKNNIPLFVIKTSKENKNLRDVYFGYVTDFDDSAKIFIIEFDKESSIEHEEDEFVSNIKEEQKIYSVKARTSQARFRISVIKRYGCKCVVCKMYIIDLIEAAHLISKSEDGTDDPRNGIPLCSLHHKAFDRNLFSFDPTDFRIIYSNLGPQKEHLMITEEFLTTQHANNNPHKVAVNEVYKNFCRKNGTKN